MSVLRHGIRRELLRGVRAVEADAGDPNAPRRLNALLGRLEFRLADGFTLFDTYMDLLTQRASPYLGPLLAGCDVLANDALRRPYSRLREVVAPLVHCDRGFGASILRQGVRLQGAHRCPMPLIQIPYSRLEEKCTLTSIMHEVGHEAIDRLGLGAMMRRTISNVLDREGCPPLLREFFYRWSSEIGPDLWCFCATGVAATGSARELFAVPPRDALRVDAHDPHPPPYLRVLFALEWCRQVWGSGPWDEWERQWRFLYPLERADAFGREVLEGAVAVVAPLAAALLRLPVDTSGGPRLCDLFRLDRLDPAGLGRRIITWPQVSIDLGRLTPCEQLAVFRLAREVGALRADELDQRMSAWLRGLRCAEARADAHDEPKREERIHERILGPGEISNGPHFLPAVY